MIHKSYILRSLCYFLSIIFLLVFSGCKADTSLSSEFDFKDIGKDGIVVMSITNNHSGFLKRANVISPTIFIKSRDIDFQLEVEGHRGTWVDKHIMKKGWPIGRVVALKVPPGSYEVYRWETDDVSAIYESIHKPDIYFDAESGKVLYVGNLDLFVDVKAKDYEFVIIDEQERDLLEFQQKWPNLCDLNIEKKLATKLQHSDQVIDYEDEAH